MAKKRTDERNGENVDGEEPNFDDPEDFVDDISDQGAYVWSNSRKTTKSSARLDAYLNWVMQVSWMRGTDRTEQLNIMGRNLT